MNGNEKKGKPASHGPPSSRPPHGRDDRRGPHGRREESTGRASAEGAVLATLHDLEKPLTSGDFDAQKLLLTNLLARIRPLRLPNIDALEFDARTRLFTALLRAGRQSPVAEAEKDAKRKEVLGLVGDVWAALGDERRAALLFAAAGRTEPAMKILKSAGEWEEAARLLLEQGKALEAARLYEQHRDHAHAAAAFKQAGDLRGVIREALQAGLTDEAREAARKLPLKAVREVLFKHGGADLYLDLLAGRGEWNEIANLYARSEQWTDAAQAYERAKRLTRAAEAWRKAGDAQQADRCMQLEVDARVGRGDLAGAGEALRRFGEPRKAIDLVRDARPDLAFRWMQQAGFDAEAITLARAEARRRTAAGELGEAATWLERAGELPIAAETFMGAGRHADALRLYEQLGDWDHAGEAAAKAGERDRAIEFLRRAGVAEPEARLAEIVAGS